jgi:CRP-like cAMP-binding protein
MTASPAQQQLRAMELFADCSDTDLDRVAPLLTRMTVAHGGVLMHEGGPGEDLMILGSGVAGVSRTDEGGSRHLGIVPSGSVVGELSLLQQTPRSATVTALVPLTVYVCNRRQFDELLQVPGVAERVAAIAARRLAANQVALTLEVPAVLADGTRLRIRPIRPADRVKLAEGMKRLSPESRRRRFFAAKETLSDASLDFLTQLDYVDHFAWVAVAADEPGQPIVGVGRYIRAPGDTEQAELALTIQDDYQGRGLGSLLLDALVVAAEVNGVERFVALVLRDNVPMCKMLRRAGGKLDSHEPGVLQAVIELDGIPTRLEPPCDPDRLRAAAACAGAGFPEDRAAG